MDIEKIKEMLVVQGTNFGLKVLGAILIWIVGTWLISMLVRVMERAMKLKHVDGTVIRYLASSLSVLLKVVLAIGILGFFGVQTATFAALLAAGGLAIGVAWGGLLANFAAGAFLIIFRPFKVGDAVTAGGVSGAVEEIGMFTTIINTPDNIKTIVGNNKIFSDNIQNFSASNYRRVDLQVPLHYSVDPMEAMKLVKPQLDTIPNVLKTPEPVVEILELNRQGTMLAVRPFCTNQNYWQVYFDTNRAVREVFNRAGYPPPNLNNFPSDVV
jgi:small conductance mechanosensitive channel